MVHLIYATVVIFATTILKVDSGHLSIKQQQQGQIHFTDDASSLPTWEGKNPVTLASTQVKPVHPESEMDKPRLEENLHHANLPSITDDSIKFIAEPDNDDVMLSFPIPSNHHQADNVSLAITKFSLNLMKSIDQPQGGNVVVSPYSIATLLALFVQGTTGDTRLQISRALRMSPEYSASSYQTITEDIRTRNSQQNVLCVANNVYVSNTFNINREFQSKAVNNFASEVTPISFADPTKAIDDINYWVALKTRNMIKKLLSIENIDDETQLVLVNAIYFKGAWQKKFKKQSTSLHPFHLASGTMKMVSCMHSRHQFRAGIDRLNKAKVLIMPFAEREYSLVVLLPDKKSNVDTILATLTPEQLAAYQTFEPIDVVLTIPKFTIRADTDLKSVLKKMGITSMFSPNSDLMGLGTTRGTAPQVSTAVHSALLTIDEEGAEAAASTAFAAVALSYGGPDFEFKVDRPFVAVLWDTNLSLPLFIARIEDPS